MEIGEVLAYLKGILPHEGAEMTAHMISRNRERAIGIFPREGRAARETAIGGIDNRSFDTVRITLLLRWGRDGGAAERKAGEIYAAVAERDEDFGFFRALNAGPVWLGMDERGIFEHVIDFDIYVGAASCRPNNQEG
ncbi:MAG: minor capsid protein [Clostridiales bacterium]|jgi:hypothetical protein|nr:minor capsid protein [Clostridiales bacterium]